MKLMNQPFNGQLGNQLLKLLNSPSYHTLNIVVAFAKNSGVLRIRNSLEEFRERGGKVNAYIGVDLGVTSYEALSNLLPCTDSLNIIHAEKGQTFHTKIYQFLGKKKGMIVVGSHNLTGGGLWTNFESSAHISIDMSNSEDADILSEQEGYFKNLNSLKDLCMPIATKDDIEKLLQNGYITKEVSQQVRSAKAATEAESRERLFGNGVRAPLPRAGITKKETTAPPTKSQVFVAKDDENETIWFESKSMTGGSRNILDLSTKSLVERGEVEDTAFDIGEPGFISGGVKFFGLDPKNTKKSKDITLNLDGVDYIGNTILYPKGKKTNGTWRLQLKGESKSKIKITETFKYLNAVEDKRYDTEDELLLFLQFKIITFTKVQDDYYYMSVYPESELKNFIEASKILARNGQSRQARQLGLL